MFIVTEEIKEGIEYMTKKKTKDEKRPDKYEEDPNIISKKEEV